MLKNEPAAAAAIAKLVVAGLSYFGLQLTEGQVLVLVLALDPILSAIVRRLSTPNAKVDAKVQEAVRRSTLPPGTIVGIVLLCALLAGCSEPTAAGALCRTRANGKWALVAEQRCPDTLAPAEQDWDQCPHRQAILDGLSADLERCPL